MSSFFQFKGVRSSAMGVHVLNYPPITMAEERVEFVEVPGRSGSLTVAQGADVYDDITLSMDCYIKTLSGLDAISGWLRGSGELILGNMPGYAYRARIVNQIEIEKIVRGSPSRTFSVVFRCNPFRYRHPAQVYSFSTISQTIRNPSSYSSEPIVTVYGNGEVSLIIGGVVIIIRDVSGSIILDCEAKLAYSPGSPTILRTASIAIPGGYWPTLVPGDSAITWTGNITRVEINPQWRWR